MERYRLAPEKLRRSLDPGSLGFGVTEELKPLFGPFNQRRAMEALRFGVGVDSRGYNIFVSGLSGSGRTSMVRGFLEELAARRPPPDDWIYVHNFDRPDTPLALRLPAGRGRALAADMETFILEARRQIAHAFETERYVERRQQLAREVAERRDPILAELDAFARERSFGIEVAPNGFAAIPLSDGHPLTSDEVEKLSDEARRDLERRGGEVQKEVGQAMRRIVQVEREGAELLVNLDREIARFALEPLLHGLRDRYAEQPDVVAHLDRIAADIPSHLPDFRKIGEAGSEPSSPLEATMAVDHTDRYRINVLVDNAGAAGVPVTVEANPTYYNLAGRVQYRPTFGMMVTDFRQIKAGALHRANGGFLILDAADVLANPFAWPALVRALGNQEVRVENLGEQYSALPMATLSPSAVPLHVKVVLVGSPRLYQLLFGLDEEFRELFKVRVDFAPEVDWTPDSAAELAAFVARCAAEHGLRPFDSGAVARLIEEAARWRDSQSKLSTRLRDLDDLVTEAAYWAGEAGHPVVGAGDVRTAVAEKARRSSLTEERLRELIADGTLRIEVDGSRTGQVNGLSVIELGDHRFGVPSRISATAAVGRGSLESIERETEMGGRIHNKGFLIVSGYLASNYGQDVPMAVRATLTFEQSYDEVEGDSASSTELYALLSALSGVPLKQSIAVTGSVDQHGNVQAVGGVTDKIEGFFKVCQAKGLSGEQGVIIPAANAGDLMLSDEVVQAARDSKFSIWAVDRVDQGIEILTGVPAGERRADGTYPPGTIHGLVSERLQTYAKVQLAFSSASNGEAHPRKATASAKTRPAG